MSTLPGLAIACAGVLALVLITRGHGRSASPWQPDGRGVGVSVAALMDDDGCAGDAAYQVAFVRDDVPHGGVITWYYPAFAAPGAPGDYQVGWRCEQYTSQSSNVLYGTEESLGFFDDLGDASTAARCVAMALAGAYRDAGPEDYDLPYLDWDGTP